MPSMTSAPNIVFFLVDDMGWRDLACQGSDFYETPHIDRLAAEGMTFTDAYASCPVCSPTRASLLTGKYPANVGVTDWIDFWRRTHPARGRLIDAPYIDHLPTRETSLAAALAEGGYQTWHVGKWHLGGEGFLPQDHGFEQNIGGCEWGMPTQGYFSPWNIPGLENPPEEGVYLPDHLTDRAMALVRERDPDRPFFLNAWYYLVHTPIQAPEPLVEKYRRKAERMGRDPNAALVPGEPHLVDHKKGQPVVRRTEQSDPTYAAMVEALDTNVGRLLACLEAEGVLEETLIIFTSDNGGLATSEGSPTCNAPLAEGKGWMYEGGTREPMLARWPGRIAPGSTCREPVTSPDLYPTCLAAAGLPARPDQHQDGENLLPLMTGDARALDRQAIYWHYPHYGNQGGTPGSSIRSGKWKLIEFFEDGRLELYDLEADLSETRNLAESEPEVRDRLHELLVSWRQRMNAKIPEPNPAWQPTDESDPTL